MVMRSRIITVLVVALVIGAGVSSGALGATRPLKRSATPMGASSPVWIERSIPGAATAIESLHVTAGNPQSLSAVVAGSSLLYSSQNGGVSWVPYLSMGAQPFIALAGSQSTFFALDAASRVYRSTTAGAFWAPLSVIADPTSDLDTGTDASTLVAATGGPGTDLAPAYSSDYGASWNVGAGPMTTWSIAAGDPTGWNIFYAARQAITDTPLASSGDGGVTWFDCGVFPMAIHATSVTVLPNGGPVLVGCDTAGASPIYRSNDGGATWTPSSSGIPAGETVLATCMAPSVSVACATTDKAVYSSMDGGTTWSDISSDLPEKPYTSVSASGGSTNTIFVGAADGTIYETSTPVITGINPASGSPEDIITLDGMSFGTGSAGSAVTFAGIAASTYVSWTNTRIRVRVPELAMSGDVIVTTPQGSSNAVEFTRTTPEPAVHTWYLAEGCTGSDGRGGFETWVLVQNPGAISADVALTFMTDEGPEPGPTLIVPPDSRTTVSVKDFVPDTWSVSTTLESTQPVIAERSVYWNATNCYRQAATDSIGVTTPATGWYLAEGCTGIAASGTFETWVLVQNPGNQAADVSLTYMTTGGPVAGPSFQLPAFSRKSIDVADTLPNCWSVSTSITSNVPVVAERSMYLNTAATYRQAATDSIGVEAGATTWYLAEGCTGADKSGAFETWVLVQNPGDQAANVQLTY
ncbi:MAG: IPT/TIG domain-containing protein, partial [Candidatus Geothermincolia bacterium]